MGRLVGIEWFMSLECLLHEHNISNEIRRSQAKQEDAETIEKRKQEIAQGYRDRFKGRILCRFASTLGKDGNPLVSLPNKSRFVLELEPTEREKEIFAKNADVIKEE